MLLDVCLGRKSVQKDALAHRANLNSRLGLAPHMLALSLDSVLGRWLLLRSCGEVVHWRPWSKLPCACPVAGQCFWLLVRPLRRGWNHDVAFKEKEKVFGGVHETPCGWNPSVNTARLTNLSAAPWPDALRPLASQRPRGFSFHLKRNWKVTGQSFSSYRFKLLANSPAPATLVFEAGAGV